MLLQFIYFSLIFLSKNFCNKWMKFKLVCFGFLWCHSLSKMKSIKYTIKCNPHIWFPQSECATCLYWKRQSARLTWNHFRFVFGFFFFKCLMWVCNNLFKIRQQSWNMHTVFVISNTSFIFKLIVKQQKDNSEVSPHHIWCWSSGVLKRNCAGGKTAASLNILILAWTSTTQDSAQLGFFPNHFHGHSCLHFHLFVFLV